MQKLNAWKVNTYKIKIESYKIHKKYSPYQIFPSPSVRSEETLPKSIIKFIRKSLPEKFHSMD